MCTLDYNCTLGCRKSEWERNGLSYLTRHCGIQVICLILNILFKPQSLAENTRENCSIKNCFFKSCNSPLGYFPPILYTFFHSFSFFVHFFLHNAHCRDLSPRGHLGLFGLFGIKIILISTFTSKVMFTVRVWSCFRCFELEMELCEIFKIKCHP